MSETEQTTEAETDIDLDERSRKSLAAAVTILRHKLGPALAGEEGAEEALTPEARVEMAGFVEWSDEDLQHVRGLAEYIDSAARPGCLLGCMSKGYTKDGTLCQCVIDHHTRERKRVPNRKKERTVDEKRVAEAEESLARAKENLAAACAKLDSKIEHCESFMAEYHAARAKLVEERDTTAQNAAWLRGQFNSETEEAERETKRAETYAEACGHSVQRLLEMRGSDEKLEERQNGRTLLCVEAKAALDASLFAANVADACQVSAHNFASSHAAESSTAGLLQMQIDTLDEDNAGAITELDRLKKERARVAGHHQPKVDKAERRLRRLTYLAGDAS